MEYRLAASYRLTGVTQPRISLNGMWQFHPNPPVRFWEDTNTSSGGRPITVPGECCMQGFAIEHDKEYAYQKRIRIHAQRCIVLFCYKIYLINIIRRVILSSSLSVKITGKDYGHHTHNPFRKVSPFSFGYESLLIVRVRGSVEKEVVSLTRNSTDTNLVNQTNQYGRAAGRVAGGQHCGTFQITEYGLHRKHPDLVGLVSAAKHLYPVQLAFADAIESD